MLTAIEEAAERRAWGTHEELLATLIELNHALLRAVMAGNGVKRPDLPAPLRIPRPGDKPREMSMGEMARSMAGRR